MWLLACFANECHGFAFQVEQPGVGRVDTETARRGWRSTMLPILQNACLDCHSGEEADGSLDLEAFEDLEKVIQQRRLWTKIATRVRDHQMPPENSSELTDEQRTAFLDWVDNVLPNVSCNHPNHAGPVTIRRLTRYEYANSVQELFKVEYPFTSAFPADEVGYGFDNIGDVLSVSPLLMEKYLKAAEDISRRVIVDPAKQKIDKSVFARDFGDVKGSRLVGAFKLLTTRGTVSIRVTVPASGNYKIKVDAYAMQAGSEDAKMAVSINGKSIKEFAVRPEDAEDAETYELVAKLKAGKNRIQVTFTNDFYNPEARNRKRRDRNLFIGTVNVTGPTNKSKASKAQQAFLFETPTDDNTARACAKSIINRHGSRAFRRLVYQGERQKLLALFDLGIENGESFEGAMQLVLQAMIVSPHFLYKVEAPVPTDGTTRTLSNYELATSLSYFLWSSMPDDQLFRKATANQLNEPSVLDAEVRRMLTDQKSIALIDNFAAQWLQLRVLQQADPDPNLFPGFTNHLRDSMLMETRLLLMDVIRKDLPLATLLTSDYTYVNKALARHYGWDVRGLSESEFSRVSLQGKSRSGLLSHASVLTLTSNPTRTSPVKRGKWVLENLLADPPPPALPDVPQLDSQEELVGTLRERMEQHRLDPNCAVCHYKMDTLGFVLENFDAFGRYRTEDENEPIDASGEMPNGTRLESVSDLQKMIVNEHKNQFVRCLVEKLFIYAIGRGPIASDDCLIDYVTKKACEQDYRFSDIVLEIVSSEAFQKRSLPQ